MSNYYQDFVGLNIFSYEPNGWDGDQQLKTTQGAIFEVLSTAHLYDIDDDAFDDQFSSVFVNFGYLTQNTIGNYNDGVYNVLGTYKNFFMDLRIEVDKPKTNPLQQSTSSYFNSLMIKRNGPYGFPSWKQIRVSENPLTRRQRKHNVFTYVIEPGDTFEGDGVLTGPRTARFGDIKKEIEPVVVSSYKPLELVGGVRNYNRRTNRYETKNIKLKTSFDNETVFFANNSINKYYETIEETDQNYEKLKELYLDDGLNDDSSPLQSFSLLTYKQTIWPQAKYTNLNSTRSRIYYESGFWRDSRTNRTSLDKTSTSGQTIPSQSVWPLDVAADWSSRGAPTSSLYAGTAAPGWYIPWYYIGGAKNNQSSEIYSGFNTGKDNGGYGMGAPTNNPTPSLGGAGVLMNTYSQLNRGSIVWFNSVIANNPFVSNPSSTTTSDLFNNVAALNYSKNGPTAASKVDFDDILTASCYYSRIHTLSTKKSLVCPSGMLFDILGTHNSQEMGLEGQYRAIHLPDLFNGHANWDVPIVSGKKPFYDTYEDYGLDVRLNAKGYSTVPEFRISNHVKFYDEQSPLDNLLTCFELSGALEQDSNSTNNKFFEVISNSDFLKSFDIIKKDHKDFTDPSILTLRCSAVKKFLPYDGFYPCQRTTAIAQEFQSSYGKDISSVILSGSLSVDVKYGVQSILQPLFAPGVLFNSIKAGVACDFPIIYPEDEPGYGRFCMPATGTATSISSSFSTEVLLPSNGGLGLSHMITGSRYSLESYRWDTIFSKRVPFEALVNPETHLARRELKVLEPHPFSFPATGPSATWGGKGEPFFIKMVNNFLAEIPEFFLEDQNFSTLSSLESSNPEFGNAVSGSFYTMRVKMFRTMDKPNHYLNTTVDYTGKHKNVPTREFKVFPPQDMWPSTGARETFTMYSRTSAFGPPCHGHGGPVRTVTSGGVGGGLYKIEGVEYLFPSIGSQDGYNFPYTPPYYHGEGWCDIIFEATETKKYTLDEIMSECVRYPYYSRFWWPGENDAYRDLMNVASIKSQYGYSGSYEDYDSGPWVRLFGETPSVGTVAYVNPRTPKWLDTGSYNTQSRRLPHPVFAGVQHPSRVNYEAMQLKSSLNIFGKGIQKQRNLDSDLSDRPIEVFDAATNNARARWVIQTKFETPMLNFNKYTTMTKGNAAPNDFTVTKPQFASESVPRGMWHQYGELPASNQGVYMQVDDIPRDWVLGALRVPPSREKKFHKSLADLVGFNKEPKKLGRVADGKKIFEAVVAVPFIEENNTRKFFTIPRADIDNTISALKREVEPGVFVAGGPPNVGNTIIDLVKKMKRYVFPPFMDFVKYNSIQPFAMYIFEFTHTLSKQDLADIWQNVSPDIARTYEHAEASISHELLAHELLGGGAVVKNGKLDDNAKGNEIPSNIRWMIFKVKKRAKTKYQDKVVAKSGALHKPALLASEQSQEIKDKESRGIDTEITYNWPYDFFSLVELVKIDAEITFSDIENDDKGNKSIKTKKAKSKEFSKNISKARGK